MQVCGTNNQTETFTEGYMIIPVAIQKKIYEYLVTVNQNILKLYEEKNQLLILSVNLKLIFD